MTDTDAWTCPRCETTTRGNARARREAQRACARKHAAETLADELDIPTPPRGVTRRR